MRTHSHRFCISEIARAITIKFLAPSAERCFRYYAVSAITLFPLFRYYRVPVRAQFTCASVFCVCKLGVHLVGWGAVNSGCTMSCDLRQVRDGGF